MTKHWLYYLGSGHFDLRNDWKLPGTFWLWCGGVLSQSCLHNLIKVKISRMNISLSSDELSEVYFIMQIQSVCLGACWVHASYQESGSWCVSSPQGLLGDGPSSLHCSKGSWFRVQSPCACCSNTSESNEQLARANNQREKNRLGFDTSLAWPLDSNK